MSPAFWLHHAALVVRQQVEHRLRPVGLTYPQFCVLGSVSWLTLRSQAPTQQDVAVTAGADRMMTSKLVRVLEENGLIVRAADPTDRRAVRLHMTAAGKSVVHQAVQLVAEVDAECFGADPARERFTRKLQALASSHIAVARHADRSRPSSPR